MNMEKLINTFEKGINDNYKYVVVIIDIENCRELIINSHKNMQKKLEFYKESYDENLIHKYSKAKIKIVDVMLINKFEELD